MLHDKKERKVITIKKAKGRERNVLEERQFSLTVRLIRSALEHMTAVYRLSDSRAEREKAGRVHYFLVKALAEAK